MLQYFTLFFPNVTRRAEGCDDFRASGYLTSDQRDSNFRARLNKAERDFHTPVITEHHLPPEILSLSHTHTHTHTHTCSEKTLWIPSPGYRPHFTNYNIWMSRKCVSHFPTLSTGVMEKTGKLFIISVCASGTANTQSPSGLFHSAGIRHSGNTHEKRLFLQSLLLRQYAWEDMLASHFFFLFGFGNSIFASALIPGDLRRCEKRRSSLKDTNTLYVKVTFKYPKYFKK